jgi:two-component system, NtrC family, sensor histidine kinase HydH
MMNRFLKLKAREAAEVQLKSLGIMAASLAHEIRNPLGAIKGLTQLAQEELPSDHISLKYNCEPS